MKNFHFLFLLVPLVFTACLNGEIDVNNEPAAGVINGEQWNLASANGYLVPFELKYEFKLLGVSEPGSGGCSAPFPTGPHLSFTVPPRAGSFSIPLPILQESVRIHENGSTSAFATSGFLEIYGVDNSRVTGYIQAVLDDENTVEGNFEVDLCN